MNARPSIEMRSGFPAKADSEEYGESPAPVGPSGISCQYCCPAAPASRRTHRPGCMSPIPCGPGTGGCAECRLPVRVCMHAFRSGAEPRWWRVYSLRGYLENVHVLERQSLPHATQASGSSPHSMEHRSLRQTDRAGDAAAPPTGEIIPSSMMSKRAPGGLLREPRVRAMIAFERFGDGIVISVHAI